MWTELDPVADRLNVMNLSLAEARALEASLANAAHYARLLRREPNEGMERLRTELQLALYGATKEDSGMMNQAQRTAALTTPHR